MRRALADTAFKAVASRSGPLQSRGGKKSHYVVRAGKHIAGHGNAAGVRRAHEWAGVKTVAVFDTELFDPSGA